MPKRIETKGKHTNSSTVRRKLRNNRVRTTKTVRPSTKPEPTKPEALVPQGHILVPSSIALIIFRSLADFYLYSKTPLGGEDWSKFCAIMHDFVNRRPDLVPSAWHEWSGKQQPEPTWREHLEQYRKTHATE